MNNKAKSKVLSNALILAIIISSCSDSRNIIISTNNEYEEEKNTYQLEEVPWAQFDESALMYKVDLKVYLSEKFKLSESAFENSDIVQLINIIREAIGEDYYTKDLCDNTLYSLEGKSISITSTKKENSICISIHEKEKDLLYEISLSEDGGTKYKFNSYFNDKKVIKYSSYSANYDNKNEYYRSISIEESQEKCITIKLFDANFGDLHIYNIIFAYDKGELYIDINKYEYNNLREIMSLYCNNDNLDEFLSDNAELLNKYLDLIREKNPEFYENLCSIINGYIEKAKNPHYE